MFVVSISARGFRDLPSGGIAECNLVEHLLGPSPAVVALGDALELAFASFSAPALERLAVRWGLVEADALVSAGMGSGRLPDGLPAIDPLAARALVDPNGDRAMRVSVELRLDPPQFGVLREFAAREPLLGVALASRPTVTVSVGALFGIDFDALAISLTGFRVGEQEFPVHGAERPAWIETFLVGLAGRFHRFDLGDDIASDLFTAVTSRDRHEAYCRWQRALQPEGPFLRVSCGPGDEPLVLGDDLPMRRYGQAGLDRVALAGAIHLSGADVLWAESEEALLQNAVDGDSSPLEQVFCVGPRGTRMVHVEPIAPTAPLGRGRFAGARSP